MRHRIVILAAAALALAAVGTTGAVRAASRGSGFAVTSTLDGKTTLPHRIHWYAHPTLPGSKVREVDFLIDGKRLWVEHSAPYSFAEDGNYLVTSILAAGTHRFEVRAVSTAGAVATDTVTAKVGTAPAPPTALRGTWQTHKDAPPSGDPPAGMWRLVISRVGWRIYDTAGTGSLVDVAYLAPGLLEVRTGMASGHPKFDLNGWCANEPGSPARFHWTATSAGLQFTFAGGKPCAGFAPFLDGSTWTKSP